MIILIASFQSIRWSFFSKFDLILDCWIFLNNVLKVSIYCEFLVDNLENLSFIFSNLL